MNNAKSLTGAKAPWHLWVVGILAVLWNGLGAVDYLMTELRHAAYLSAFTAEQIAYFENLPKWTIATWATGVWGGVIGAALILLRRRLAAPVLAASLAAAAATFFYNFVLSNGLRIMGGPVALVMPALVMIIGILLLLYARKSVGAGWLR